MKTLLLIPFFFLSSCGIPVAVRVTDSTTGNVVEYSDITGIMVEATK